MPPLESAAHPPPAALLSELTGSCLGPPWAVALAMPIPPLSQLSGAPPPSLWAGRGSGQRGGDLELGPFSDCP